MEMEESLETAKIILPRRKGGPYQRGEILKAISHHVADKDVLGLGMLQAYYEWSVYTSKEKIERLIEERNFKLEDGTEMVITGMNSREVQIRIQWLPFSVTNEEIKKFFEKFGEVVSLKNETCFEQEFSHMWNGVRLVTLDVAENVSVNDIPHATKIAKFPALITVSGRKPLCFKCGNEEHVFKDCPKREKNKKSFAEALKNKGAQIYEDVAEPLLRELSIVLNPESKKAKIPPAGEENADIQVSQENTTNNTQEEEISDDEVMEVQKEKNPRERKDSPQKVSKKPRTSTPTPIQGKLWADMVNDNEDANSVTSQDLQGEATEREARKKLGRSHLEDHNYILYHKRLCNNQDDIQTFQKAITKSRGQQKAKK